VHLTNEEFVYELSDSGRKLLVCLNVGDTAAKLPVPYGKAVLNGTGSLTRSGQADAIVDLASHSYAVIE